MTIAWEGGHLPVFFGDPASSDELSLEREVSLQLPTNEHGKRALRRLMADVATDSRSALTRLIEDLEVPAKQSKLAENALLTESSRSFDSKRDATPSAIQL